MRVSDAGPGLPDHDPRRYKKNPVQTRPTALPRGDIATLTLRIIATIYRDPLIRLKEKTSL